MKLCFLTLVSVNLHAQSNKLDTLHLVSGKIIKCHVKVDEKKQRILYLIPREQKIDTVPFTSVKKLNTHTGESFSLKKSNQGFTLLALQVKGENLLYANFNHTDFYTYTNNQIFELRKEVLQSALYTLFGESEVNSYLRDKNLRVKHELQFLNEVFSHFNDTKSFSISSQRRKNFYLGPQVSVNSKTLNVLYLDNTPSNQIANVLIPNYGITTVLPFKGKSAFRLSASFEKQAYQATEKIYIVERYFDIFKLGLTEERALYNFFEDAQFLRFDYFESTNINIEPLWTYTFYKDLHKKLKPQLFIGSTINMFINDSFRVRADYIEIANGSEGFYAETLENKDMTIGIGGKAGVGISYTLNNGSEFIANLSYCISRFEYEANPIRSKVENNTPIETDKFLPVFGFLNFANSYYGISVGYLVKL